MIQHELAELLKVKHTTVYALESGKRPISLAMAKRLTKIIEVQYQVFL
jgi:plasmid maintenance system antidote protein VapI